LKLDCRTCTPNQKIERGCKKDSPIKDIWQIDDWKFQRCPLKIVTIQSLRYIEAYNFYEKGYLPNTGGWLDQSAKLLKAIKVISNRINKDRKDERI